MKASVFAVGASIFLTALCTVSAAAEEPALLIAPGARVVLLADGFRFTEGPAADRQGNIYFTDIPNNRIHRWSVAGALSTVREDSGGANGLYFDPSGNLLACEMGRRRVTATAPDGSVTVLADRYAGRKLNMTNDLWIDPRGGVYFSDPHYSDELDGLEQDGFHVYYITPDRSRVIRVIDDLDDPNGLVGTAGGERLYVADPGSQKTYVYRIQTDGSLTERRVAAPAGVDGLTLDEHENLYVAADSVEIYSPEGARIGAIETPERPANLTFGGRDGRTLFIAARTGFYSIRMRVRGQSPAP